MLNRRLLLPLSKKEEKQMRYFFHIREGGRLIPDDEGDELADPIDASFEARMIARDMVMENLRAGRELDGRKIEITDANGKIIETMRVRDVVDVG